MRLIPRDEEFFKMFGSLASLLTQSARMLQELFGDPTHVNDKVAAIK